MTSNVRVIKDDSESKELVSKYRPIIYQEWKDIRDCLTPLILGGVQDETSRLTDIINGIKQPTLYYKVMEDDSWYYVATVVYHPWDWSDHPIAFIRKLDSHRHDTESILMRIEKNKAWLGPRRIDICTMFHTSFMFKRHSDRKVHIQSEGHGITPFNPKKLKEECNFIRYTQYDFVSWANVKKPEWEELRTKLKGVNLPDRQFDGQLSLRFRSRGEMNHRPGDNWKRPDILFRQAEITNRI